MAATSASATARNSGEASAARVLGIGSAALGPAATGVPRSAATGDASGDANGEATGVVCAASRRPGPATAAVATAPVAARSAARREKRRSVKDASCRSLRR